MPSTLRLHLHATKSWHWQWWRIFFWDAPFPYSWTSCSTIGYNRFHNRTHVDPVLFWNSVFSSSGWRILTSNPQSCDRISGSYPMSHPIKQITDTRVEIDIYNWELDDQRLTGTVLRIEDNWWFWPPQNPIPFAKKRMRFGFPAQSCSLQSQEMRFVFLLGIR